MATDTQLVLGGCGLIVVTCIAWLWTAHRVGKDYDELIRRFDAQNAKRLSVDRPEKKPKPVRLAAADYEIDDTLEIAPDGLPYERDDDEPAAEGWYPRW